MNPQPPVTRMRLTVPPRWPGRRDSHAARLSSVAAAERRRARFAGSSRPAAAPGRCSSLEEIGTTRAPQPGLLHDRAGEAAPARRAAAGEVVDAGRAALDELERGAREVRCRGRAADLVVDHAQLVALRAEAQHREQEVVAARREHPGRAHDVGLGVLGQQRALARELGGAVDAARRDRRALVVAARGRRRRTRSRSRTRRARPRRPARRARRDGCRTRSPARRRRDPTPRRRRRSRRRSAARARGGARRTRAAPIARRRRRARSRPGAAASAPSSSANSRPSWPPPPVTSTRVMRRAERASGSSSTTGPARARRPSARSARRDRRGRTPR